MRVHSTSPLRWIRLVAVILGISFHGAASAAFSGTDVLVPAVARASGLNQSSFFTTLLITVEEADTLPASGKVRRDAQPEALLDSPDWQSS